MKENLGALDIQLKPEDVQEVRRLAETADAAKVQRYPDALMQAVFAETPELQ